MRLLVFSVLCLCIRSSHFTEAKRPPALPANARNRHGAARISPQLDLSGANGLRERDTSAGGREGGGFAWDAQGEEGRRRRGRGRNAHLDVDLVLLVRVHIGVGKAVPIARCIEVGSLESTIEVAGALYPWQTWAGRRSVGKVRGALFRPE